MNDDTIELRNRVETAAERLGASRAAVFKWRQRGIPGDWKIRLLSDVEAGLSLDDFDKLASSKSETHNSYPRGAQ